MTEYKPTKKFVVYLSYRNKTYRIEMDWHLPMEEKVENVLDTFPFEEGSYACDCNLSLFIQQQCDKDFKRLDCGEQIKILETKVLIEKRVVYYRK